MATKVLPLLPWQTTVLATSRNSEESAQAVHEIALDLFALGFYKQANVLLTALYDHSNGLALDLNTDTTVLYYAWEAFDCLPSWIQHPDPEKPFRGRDHLLGGEPRWNRFKNRWVDGLPQGLRQTALDEGHVEDAELQILIKELEDKDHDIMAEPNISIGAVVQAATLAGQTEKARSIVENVAHLYRHFQDPTNQPDVYKDGLRDQMNKRLGLCHAPNIWKYLKEANIGEVLRIDSRSVDNYVAEGCRLIEKRFTEGPDRPYSDHSIEDLVHMLDEAKKSQSFPSSDEEDVASNMQNPATEEDITELETRLGREPRLSNYQNAQAYATQIEPDATPLLPEGSLPQDYKDFLRVTNGFYLHGPDDQGCLFYGTEGIDASDDQLGIHDLDFLLFPYNMTSLSGDEIEMGEFRGFSIGACGDEGQALLIPRSSIEPTLKWFERVYAQADTRRKREYERGALDIYGGIDQLRSIEWLCIESFHWDPETTIFNGFRQYLEYCVERAVNKADHLHEREEEKAEQERRTQIVAGTGEKRKRGHGED